MPTLFVDVLKGRVNPRSIYIYTYIYIYIHIGEYAERRKKYDVIFIF